VITHELHSSISHYNHTHATDIDSSLWVLADLAGVAAHAAAYDDYLIPSSILNATISGLISRSILDDSIGTHDFHGCLYYQHLAAQDLSLRYVDDLCQRAELLAQSQHHANAEHPAQTTNDKAETNPTREARHRQVKALVENLMQQHDVAHINHLKPGIGEATRVLLRRTPGLLILSAQAGDDVAHMRALAQEKNVATITVTDLAPYQAVAIIKDVRHATH
jgi:ribosomal protein L7Ae-like RNA K-turn-binding protein